MDISPFELLLKPIAPRTATASQANVLSRVIVQGYFLTVSNLEKRDRELKLFLTISEPSDPPNASPPNETRILDNKTVLLYDVAAKNIPINFKRIEAVNEKFIRYESDSFILPSWATVSLQLLPDVQQFLNNQQSFLEVRGFASLTSDDSTASGELFFNPEIRGTFIPDNLTDPVKDIDFDQIAYSLGTTRAKV
ncbi:hypothetical protein C7H19_11750 [Aphanothece hegewaldii CCALA 016]|uniref:Uncharacterized protein n=1 Tax=Aphanothece hegewaldii CCALA 016 TaxID=2107694 RepID=A0A2T1LXJ1_9CHRO|nr:hypothetical protein [Aphanothece hegewaldii]PSF37105.1 hypothetical protein C7H19_11750 [Aphanothece hegewaldii CCALA 016]